MGLVGRDKNGELMGSVLAGPGTHCLAMTAQTPFSVRREGSPCRPSRNPAVPMGPAAVVGTSDSCNAMRAFERV